MKVDMLLTKKKKNTKYYGKKYNVALATNVYADLYYLFFCFLFWNFY